MTLSITWSINNHSPSFIIWFMPFIPPLFFCPCFFNFLVNFIHCSLQKFHVKMMTLQGAHISISREYRAKALRSGRKQLSIPGWGGSTPSVSLKQPQKTAHQSFVFPYDYGIEISWGIYERKIRIGSTGLKLYPPIFGLGWNIAEVTFTDHLFLCFPSPISCN